VLAVSDTTAEANDNRVGKVGSITWTATTPKRISSIGKNLIWNKKSLAGSLDVSGCTALTRLYCGDNPLTDLTVGWTTIPSLYYLSLPDVSQATLHVPHGTAALYRAADYWKDFGTIIEDPALSTEVLPSPSVSVFSVGTTLSVLTPNNETVTVYSANGSLLFRSSKLPGQATFTIGHLPKGVIIVKGSTGWVRKLFR
jgi:hypothetical protein